MATKFPIAFAPPITGEELDFFKRVTHSMITNSGQRHNHLKNYSLQLTHEGFRQLVYAMKRCGGSLLVPPFEPSAKERE